MLRREHWELSGPAWVVFLAGGTEGESAWGWQVLRAMWLSDPGRAVSAGTLQR